MLRIASTALRPAFTARQAAIKSFSTATVYEETWHTREAALQDRLEDYKRPLTREEEGLRFQIKFVSNRDVSERDDAPETRASS